MTDDPGIPFTRVELEIADLAGRGFGHVRIAALLNRGSEGVRSAINDMAAKLPNPDDLPALTLVQLWGAHRRWLRENRDTAA